VGLRRSEGLSESGRKTAWAGRPIFARRRAYLAALAVLAAALALPAPAAAEATPFASARPSAPPLPTRLARALAVPHVNHARSSAVALDLDSGTVVFSRHGRLSLAPASTEKLTLTYGLLVHLGPAYRIRTTVLTSGGLEGATLVGNLVLHGEGDPTLSGTGLRRLAAHVRASGIERVAGSVVGDESFFDARRTAPGWKPWYYIRESPPLSALTANRARFRGSTSHAPALAAAAAFKDALKAAGVAVTGRAIAGRADPDAVEVAALASPPLLQILRTVNRESDNFTAEILLKHLGATVTGRGTTPAGAAVVRRALSEAGVPLAGVRIVDGSGLSLLDRLTADALVALLAAVWDDPVLRDSFVQSLAVSGRSGTLRRRLREPPAAGRVFAKTGTTAISSALAGYVSNRFAFAVLQNGPPLSSWWSRRAQDRFVTVLAGQ
jgi:D-alanyl-D-alanine carboxypeptidase/D-alanyl-D-alanine-endopeptidase (penicillin-binding protein 4)